MRPRGPRSLRLPIVSGRSPATVKAYFYGPTGEKARAVKARYVGLCRGCGAYTQPRNGKGDAYAYCKACHPGAIQTRWTHELVLGAMLEWHRRFGRLPTSYDWSATHARKRGGEALERLTAERWPPASVVGPLFGNWARARSLALVGDGEADVGSQERASSGQAVRTPGARLAVRAGRVKVVLCGAQRNFRGRARGASRCFANRDPRPLAPALARSGPSPSGAPVRHDRRDRLIARSTPERARGRHVAAPQSLYGS